MNHKLYALFVILTSDEKNTYCLSTDKLDLILPNIEISNTEYLHDEVRYNIRKFFDPGEFKFNEECDFNFLSLQNPLSLSYIKDTLKEIDFTSDLIITYGGILEKNILNNHFYWYKLQFNTNYNGFTKNKNLNLLIDHVINKTII